MSAAALPSTSTATGSNKSDPDVADVLEERLIDMEYKVWKKNTPYLYDFVMTHSLEWPSLTCQWLPTTKNISSGSVEHSLLLGTHTTGEQNYLMTATVHLPKSDAVLDQRISTAKENATESSTTNNNKTTQPAAQYDEEKGELGGFGQSSNPNVGKMEIRLKIRHEGEVNRARYMPQNHFIVASRGPNPQVYIWDLSKHPSFPTEPYSTPQGVCVGHEREGYGLAWSKHKEGYLATASEDATVRVWDIGSSTIMGKNAETGTQISSQAVLKGHTSVVEDVDWHERDANLLGTVSDDKTLKIWDIRDPTSAVHNVVQAHQGDINCLAFNPNNDFVVATGSADKTVAIWDLRNLKASTTTLNGHNDQVYNLEWAPFNESILASCSADRRVAIWDLSRIGMEQSEEDAEDGPPELLFLHGGHTSKVSDICWNGRDEWSLASVSEDNVLQVWNMAEEIYAAEDEEDVSAGEGEDVLLGEDELEG